MVSQGSISQEIEGIVARTNERGIQLTDRDAWLNLSRYADPAPAIPAAGSRVRIGLDKSGYIRTVEMLEAPPAPEPGTAGEIAPAPVDRDMRIMRQAVLNTATAVLASGGQVDVDELLELAARLEAWVLR